MTTATGDSLSFGYDALKRLNRVTVKNGSYVILNTAYAYRDVSWNRGSAQVEFRNVRLGSDSGMLLEGKKYSYDKAGNLVMISESTGDFNKLVEYTYDSQNQLTSEAYYKSGEAEAYITYNYTYDTAGNLLTVSQKKGNTTTLLQTYTYGDAQWHDLLTAVNGQVITYDASGNPLSYGGWSFGWQNGRQLKTASKTSDGKTETLEYAYDADGIRTSKTYTVETFTQLPDYTVTFQADGATVKTMTVEDGYTLKDSDYPAVPTKTGYTGEWVKYTTAIHSNVTVQVKYTAVSTDHTVTFKANGKTVKTMVVPDGYVLQDSDYPPIPPRVGYKGSWSKVTTAIRRDTVIYASYMPNGGGIVIPTQPTSPGEIMSGGEGEPVENEPVEADVPAKDETVSPQGMHVTGTQTVTHEYLTLNGKVARETIRTNNTLTAVLDFVYDESGKPFALKYSTNGTSFQTYYYVLNLQGDVVKLIHYIPGFEYESVATYEYDAWGNVSSSGRLAEINPLRYRGYYYDSETGFYYLQSRYYDPANRRFISADRHLSTGQGFVGTNMFAYCNNSPVFLVDYDGDEAETVEWWAASMWWLCAVDGPIPVGDIIYGAGLLLVGGVTLLTIGDSNIPQVESESDKKASAEDGVNIDTEEETNSAQSSDTKSPKRNKHNKRPSLKAISKQLCKRLGIDPHEIKHEFLGNSGKISRYDLFYDTNTGIIYIISKDGSVIIETYYCVIDKSIHMN